MRGYTISSMHAGNYRIVIGRVVRKERLKRGWTQEELAEKIDTHPSFVGQLERGLKAASLDTLKRLSTTFGIKPADLLKDAERGNLRQGTQPMEQKIIDLLRGCSTREQEAVYQTIKYILRRKRKLSK